MARLEATLANELQNLAPTSSAPAGALALAEAYGEYLKGAAGLTPIIGASVDSLAVPAMAGAMAFVTPSTPAAGAAVVLAGVNACWAAMVAAPASFFASATLIAPPTFATLAADLATSFTDNVNDGNDLTASATLIASVLHGATVGATVTTPGPVVTPIT